MPQRSLFDEPPARASAMAVATAIVGVPDRPPELFEFGLAKWNRFARAIVGPIETGLGDAVAWRALLDSDPDTNEAERAIAGAVAVYGRRLRRTKQNRMSTWG